MKRPQDLELWRGELDRFVAKLEEVTGRALTAEDLQDAIEGGQRQAPRAAAPERRPHGLARPDQRQGCAARRAGRLLRRRAALHADGEQDRRRARGAGRRRARRGPGGRAARTHHRQPDEHPQLEGPRPRREGRRGGRRRGALHRLALLRETGRRGRNQCRGPAGRHRREVPRHQLRLLHPEPRPHRGRGAAGAGVQGRRHPALRAAVLRAVSDRGDVRGARRRGRRATCAARRHRLLDGGRRASSARASRPSSRCSRPDARPRSRRRLAHGRRRVDGGRRGHRPRRPRLRLRSAGGGRRPGRRAAPTTASSPPATGGTPPPSTSAPRSSPRSAPTRSARRTCTRRRARSSTSAVRTPRSSALAPGAACSTSR